MKALVLIIALFTVHHSFANQIIEREIKIKVLLEKEITLVEQVKNPGLNLKRRLLELYSERLAIIKKIEDQEFIEQKHGKQTKTYYYQKSQGEYKRIHAFGLDLIKKHASSQELADIYYTLALNSRDFGNDNKTEHYLVKSLVLARNKSLQYNIRSAMSDYYYNEKKYKKAIEHYEWIISHFDDEWKSKNLYNLSWCYLKVEKFKIALELQLESYHRSSIPGSVDMREQAINSLPTFFVLADRSKDGLNFFLERNDNTAEAIIKMAKRASENGEYAQALYLLNQTQDFLITKSNFPELIKIKNYFLTFYKQYHRYDDHLKVAHEIKDLSKQMTIDSHLLDEIVNHIKTHAGYLQIRLVKSASGHSSELRSINSLEHIVNYFEILMVINTRDSDEYAYYLGETYLSSKKYTLSYQAYRHSVEFIEQSKKDSSFTKKALLSLLAMVERKWIKKELQNKLTEFTFTKYITLLPNDELTEKIYPRLYDYYSDISDLKLAEKTLLAYADKYPKNVDDQKQLARHLVDQYIKIENTSSLSLWIKRMEQAFLGFSKDEKVKTEIILGQILFKKAGEQEIAGNQEHALGSYLALYKVEHYPVNIRANAALKRSVLLAKTNQMSESLKWFNLAFKLFESDELAKQKKTISALADYHMLKQSIDTAKDISLEIISTYCSIDNKLTNEHFSRAARLYPLLDEYSSLVKHLKQTKCPVPTELAATEASNVFVGWMHVGNHEYLKKFHHEFASNNKNINILYTNHLKENLWHALTRNDTSQGLAILSELNALATMTYSDKAIQDEVKLIEKSVAELGKIKSINPETFMHLTEQKTLDEDKLMQNLNLAIENLNLIKTISDKLISSKIPEIINFASSELAQYYLKQAHIFKTIRINHADIDYLKSFYEQMTSLANSTTKTGQSYLDKNISFIQKNNILSISNQRLFTTNEQQSLLQEINLKPYLAAVDKK